MGLPDIVKECSFVVLMMYVLCLAGFLQVLYLYG